MTLAERYEWENQQVLELYDAEEIEAVRNAEGRSPLRP
jgi:hypothetical protein